VNIESKRYSLRSMRFGGVEIMHKESGACRVVEPGDLPSVNALALMHENAFDQLMIALLT